MIFLRHVFGFFYKSGKAILYTFSVALSINRKAGRTAGFFIEKDAYNIYLSFSIIRRITSRSVSRMPSRAMVLTARMVFSTPCTTIPSPP